MQHMNIWFWARRLTPFVLCLLLIVCHLIPFHFLPYYPYGIQWIYIPIFYFAIYNPKCLSSWSVFLLGIISELLTQSPFGVSTFCFVSMFFVANFLRKYLLEFTFFPLWVVFSSALLGIEVLEYLLMSLLSNHTLAFQPMLVEFWILALSYPFLMRFCTFLDHKIREQT